MAVSEIEDCTLQLSPYIAAEASDATGVTIYNVESGARLKLSPAAHKLLCKFSAPALVRAVLEKADHNARTTLLECVGMLVQKGALLESGRNQQPTRRADTHAVSTTLFRSPRHFAGQRSQVAVLGIPFDQGNLTAAGAKKGPGAIRFRSCEFEYQLDVISGRPKGWFDIDRGETILEGVSIADWGELTIAQGEAWGSIHSRITAVCNEILNTGALPLILGGDHSISFAVVRAVSARRPLWVIWLDAHNDLAELKTGMEHNHANVARRILSLPEVVGIVQIGTRGYTIAGNGQLFPNRCSTVTAGDLQQHGWRRILDLIPRDSSCYLSIDIDVLDPSVAPGTSTPVPDGPGLRMIKDVLHSICSERHIVGLDVVEVNPERDIAGMTAAAACECILAALGACRIAPRTESGIVQSSKNAS